MEDKDEEGTYSACRLASTVEQKYDRASGCPCSKQASFALEGKSIDLPGCYFLKLARIPNEDPAYPNIFLGMVFLRSKGHLAKPRNVHRLR